MTEREVCVCSTISYLHYTVLIRVNINNNDNTVKSNELNEEENYEGKKQKVTWKQNK